MNKDYQDKIKLNQNSFYKRFSRPNIFSLLLNHNNTIYMKNLMLLLVLLSIGLLTQAQEFTVRPYNRIKYSMFNSPEEKEVSYLYHFTNDLVTKTIGEKLVDEFSVDSVVIKRDYEGSTDDRTIYYYTKWLSKKTGQYYKNLFKITIDEDVYSESISIKEFVFDKDEITILYYSYYDIEPVEQDFSVIKNLIHAIP